MYILNEPSTHILYSLSLIPPVIGRVKNCVLGILTLNVKKSLGHVVTPDVLDGVTVGVGVGVRLTVAPGVGESDGVIVGVGDGDATGTEHSVSLTQTPSDTILTVTVLSGTWHTYP